MELDDYGKVLSDVWHHPRLAVLFSEYNVALYFNFVCEVNVQFWSRVHMVVIKTANYEGFQSEASNEHSYQGISSLSQSRKVIKPKRGNKSEITLFKFLSHAIFPNTRSLLFFWPLSHKIGICCQSNRNPFPLPSPLPPFIQPFCLWHFVNYWALPWVQDKAVTPHPRDQLHATPK